mgnify:CR=1 FL=1
MKGLGIDLCEIKRIEAAMAKNAGFLPRYFTPEEQAYIAGRGAVGVQSAAGMFAAKEAFLKALGVGLSGGVAMADVGVSHDALGRPTYALGEKALEQVRKLGAERAHLSVTHDGGMAAAVCVIE